MEQKLTSGRCRPLSAIWFISVWVSRLRWCTSTSSNATGQSGFAPENGCAAASRSQRTNRMKLETKKALCVVIVVIGIVNFIAYVSIAGYLGGDAVNGHSENGHYFL